MADELSPFFKLRVRYVKHGRLRYLSHLEVLRGCERMVRRARLPVAVTQGFSPHMRIAFGPALPAGVASDDEWLDIVLSRLVPAQDALEALARSAVEDLRPLEASYVPMRAPSLSAALTISCWEAAFCVPDATKADAEALARTLLSASEALLAQGSLTYLRNGKEKAVSLQDKMARPFAASVDERGAILSFATRSSNAGALRPDALCRELLCRCLPLATAGRERGAEEGGAVVSSQAADARVSIVRRAQYLESEEGTWQRPI